MQHNGMNDIYSGEPQQVNGMHELDPTEFAAQFTRRHNLPKFELGKNENFYITREQLVKLNETYFQMLDDMREGLSVTPQDMRSYMESVVFASYQGEINKLQRSGEIDGRHKKEVHNTKLSQMTPGWIRRWYQLRSRPNYAMSLCLKEADLEAEIENSVYREKIAMQELKLYGSLEGDDEQSEEKYVQKNVQELFDTFIDTLVPKRKRKRFIKKNGEYLSGLLEEFIRRQRAMLKLSQKAAEEHAEADSGEPGNSVAEFTEEAQTAPEQVSDGEALEEDSEESDYRDYEPEEDDFEALYELEESDEEPNIEEEESVRVEAEASPDEVFTAADPESEAKERTISEEEQDAPGETEQQPQEPELEGEPREPEEISELSEEPLIEEADDKNQE